MGNSYKAIIMGAAGRDFHNFNVYFRNNPTFDVVAFTAAQIPDIEGRVYPKQLAGSRYARGIPILAEEDMPRLITEQKIDYVFLSYSDLSHLDVMHKASLAMASGANFALLGPRETQLRSCKPVVSVCAVRTGSGKSQTSRKIAKWYKDKGYKVVAIRHPMPYGDLVKQVCQRFETYDDLARYQCTIEEREEYEPHLKNGIIVYAGVDYEIILRQAEKEADVIIWDGGNNDFPFYKSDLQIVVADPHRAGHEDSYHPGETNVRMADILLINKVDTAKKDDVRKVELNLKRLNPRAKIIHAASPIALDDPKALRGKKVLAVEDGPTLTHGGMRYGAATIAAQQHGCKALIDPRPYAVGSIKDTFRKYPDIGVLLPAMGYGEKQIHELQQTINKVPCDTVLIGTPIDLGRLIKINKPAQRVTYSLKELDTPLDGFLGKVMRR
ncbi:GTPase [Candidatus Woesearchaeota archaeon]|nr:GTPase [Candidatus Woesearchaeota archaeon]